MGDILEFAAYVRTLSICKDNVCVSKKQTYKGFSSVWNIFAYFFAGVGGFFVALLHVFFREVICYFVP